MILESCSCFVEGRSGAEGAHPVTNVERWNQKQKIMTKVPRPAVVRKYNQQMGGVDLLDSLIALYRTKMRSKKWYHWLLFPSWI